MVTKVVEGWDTRWKVLEGAWVVGTCGSEFWCYTECNRPPLVHPTSVPCHKIQDQMIQGAQHIS